MALRAIRLLGDEILTKPCREVKDVTPRILELIDDMMETMYDANGVGLSAPQVGVLRRVAVIDVGVEEPDPLILINPVITRKEGEQTGDEGCLSFPGKVGQVTRPNEVTVRYFDENMDEYELDAEGILARAVCHEVDHLDGHMYVEFVEGEIRDAEGDDEDESDEFDEDFDDDLYEEFDDDLDEEYDEDESVEYDEDEMWDDEYDDEEPEIKKAEPRLIRRHDEPKTVE